MAAEVEPARLAEVLDAAERPRASGWSLRAALTRYAQPQPQRGRAIIELVRRIESALRPHAKLLERDGEAIWSAVDAAPGGRPAGADSFVVELLQAMVALDELADELASWAVERAGERPDEKVDAVVADVTARLARLGVEREERPGPAARGRARG